MEYISTRGSKVGSFQNVLMKGLAQDGGLFIPNEWPQINTNELQDKLFGLECNFEKFIGFDFKIIARALDISQTADKVSVSLEIESLEKSRLKKN